MSKLLYWPTHNCFATDFEEFEKKVELMIEQDIEDKDVDPHNLSDSIILFSNYKSIRDQEGLGKSKRPNFLDTSIGTLLSSSMSSASNMQTITLSSMDSTEFNINRENVFGGGWDIDAIIKEQEKYQ